MSVFKMSNQIFSEDFLQLKLTPNELYIYTYLCSVHSHYSTLLGDLIKVKQAKIAQKCGIKTTETVSRCITSLMKKGLISRVIKSVKSNRQRGTNSYIINKPSNKDGFFYVDRNVFGQISARQMRVYLFLAKSYDKKRNDSWNSYNDIANQLKISRQEAIKNVAELLQLKFITKSLRKAKNNRRVYVDNHYTIILSVPQKTAKKAQNPLNSQSYIRISYPVLSFFSVEFPVKNFLNRKIYQNLKLPFT
ncbi:MAG: hypothetical protein RSA79_07530 [Oscillospiraceae bacterium]